MNSNTDLPVAVIGAGPIGLAATAHLLARGQTPIVFEAGDAIRASIRQWSHVRFFSPWKYSVDAVSVALLEPTGWTMPDPETAPTGHDIVERYLEPLAALPQIAPYLRLNSRVTAIARGGHDKMKTANREQAPSVPRVETPDGEDQVLAKALIDASGTWTSPNPLGANDFVALGEATAREHVFYGIPDVLGADRQRYSGQRVAVVGSGHSAFAVGQFTLDHGLLVNDELLVHGRDTDDLARLHAEQSCAERLHQWIGGLLRRGTIRRCTATRSVTSSSRSTRTLMRDVLLHHVLTDSDLAGDDRLFLRSGLLFDQFKGTATVCTDVLGLEPSAPSICDRTSGRLVAP